MDGYRQYKAAILFSLSSLPHLSLRLNLLGELVDYAWGRQFVQSAFPELSCRRLVLLESVDEW